MSIPAIILLVLYAADQFLVAYKHGTDAPKYDFWASLIAKFVVIGLLTLGGFFN